MDQEMAWAVGLFEGEGCISILKARYPHIQLKTTDPDVLERFARAMERAQIKGSINGPYSSSKNPHYKKHWRWISSGWYNLERLRTLMWPLLGHRRRANLDKIINAKPDQIRIEYQRSTNPNRLVCLDKD